MRVQLIHTHTTHTHVCIYMHIYACTYIHTYVIYVIIFTILIKCKDNILQAHLTDIHIYQPLS